MSPRVLVLGAGGMLGHKLCQRLSHRFDCWGTIRSNWNTLAECGILDARRAVCGVDALYFGSVLRAFGVVRPDVVVNCIGIVKQRNTATDPIISLEINSLLPHRLTELCCASGARLIHISTDCVFSGRRGMYTEEDISDADDTYGKTKFLGEVAGQGSLTIRTSIIGRELTTSSGLLEWFLANRGGRVRGFTQAVFSGFTTTALAQIVAEVIETHSGLEGVYHVSSEPISKHSLLDLINRVFGAEISIEPDPSVTCDRSLDSSRFRSMTNFRAPSWPQMIEEIREDAIRYDVWRSTTTKVNPKGTVQSGCLKTTRDRNLT